MEKIVFGLAFKMSIWFREFSLLELNERGKNTLADFLDIHLTDITDNTLTAMMPVSNKVKQPIGIVHGGANVVLAETLASTAANMVVCLDKFYCVGLEININHIRSVTEGFVIAETRPLHIGRTTQVWHIDLRNDAGKLTAVSRMTASVLSR